MQELAPSEELLKSLLKIASFPISPDAIQRVEFQTPKERERNEMGRVVWPEEHDRFVKNTTREAIAEAVSIHPVHFLHC